MTGHLAHTVRPGERAGLATVRWIHGSPGGELSGDPPLKVVALDDSAFLIRQAGRSVSRRQPGGDPRRVERLHGAWDYFVQITHPGTIRLDGDTASGRAYLAEFGRFRDGGSHLNYAIYHNRYRRTPDCWKFTEHVYQVKYLDTTPLAGSAPHPAASAS